MISCSLKFNGEGGIKFINQNFHLTCCLTWRENSQRQHDITTLKSVCYPNLILTHSKKHHAASKMSVWNKFLPPTCCLHQWLHLTVWRQCSMQTPVIISLYCLARIVSYFNYTWILQGAIWKVPGLTMHDSKHSQYQHLPLRSGAYIYDALVCQMAK